ncbi:hypothetical protein DMB42_11365 [Nonomuraea sp. WAC 01424]|nr:hypothetical protein DMB42_11365 [Nonomuraea sp. WAC 01424]
MEEATPRGDVTNTPLPSPPDLQHYRTWHDDSGYHARLHRELPDDALAYGCMQHLHADTAPELHQKAVNNQARVWLWETAVEEP